jgi:hypothetical protein
LCAPRRTGACTRLAIRERSGSKALRPQRTGRSGGGAVAHQRVVLDADGDGQRRERDVGQPLRRPVSQLRGTLVWAGREFTPRQTSISGSHFALVRADRVLARLGRRGGGVGQCGSASSSHSSSNQDCSCSSPHRCAPRSTTLHPRARPPRPRRPAEVDGHALPKSRYGTARSAGMGVAHASRLQRACGPARAVGPARDPSPAGLRVLARRQPRKLERRPVLGSGSARLDPRQGVCDLLAAGPYRPL